MNQQLLYKTPKQLAQEEKIYRENYSKGLHYPKTFKDKIWNEPKYNVNEFTKLAKGIINQEVDKFGKDTLGFYDQFLYGHKLSQLNCGFMSNMNTGGYRGVGGWKELGRASGGGTTSFSVSSIPDKRYYMILGSSFFSTTHNSAIQFNSDTGSNYATRREFDNSESVWGSEAYSQMAADHRFFHVGYVSNLSTNEKLLLGHTVRSPTTGSGTAPNRGEYANKWANTANPIDTMTFMQQTTSVNLDSNAELVVLGWDPDDVHTTNFWEELASVETTSTGIEIDSGTITAKKYLWVQVYIKNNGTGTIDPYLRPNDDTGSNMAARTSLVGGGDTTDINNSIVFGRPRDTSAPDFPYFANMFIINTSANEKLLIGHSIFQNTAGAANAPRRSEFVSKWANTSNQITNIKVRNNGGTDRFASGSILKVWGSD